MFSFVFLTLCGIAGVLSQGAEDPTTLYRCRPQGCDACSVSKGTCPLDGTLLLSKIACGAVCNTNQGLGQRWVCRNKRCERCSVLFGSCPSPLNELSYSSEEACVAACPGAAVGVLEMWFCDAPAGQCRSCSLNAGTCPLTSTLNLDKPVCDIVCDRIKGALLDASANFAKIPHIPAELPVGVIDQLFYCDPKARTCNSCSPTQNNCPLTGTPLVGKSTCDLLCNDPGYLRAMNLNRFECRNGNCIPCLEQFGTCTSQPSFALIGDCQAACKKI